MEEKYNFASQQNFYMHLYKVKIVGNHSLLENCKSKPQWGIISHWSEWPSLKNLLKILQPRPQQYMNCELLGVQAGFRKGRRTRDQIANVHWIIEKAENSRKTSISASLTMPKSLTMWSTTNCGKFLELGIPDHLSCLLRNLFAS